MSAERSLKSFWFSFCKIVERSTIEEESLDDKDSSTIGDNKVKLRFQSFQETTRFCQNRQTQELAEKDIT